MFLQVRTADGRTGRERHNEFAVRFKFRVLETCEIFHSTQISQLGIARYLYAILRYAKLQRTANRLYCLYPIYPSAACSFPPLEPSFLVHDQRTCALWNPGLFVYFNFLGELISDIYKNRKSRHSDYRLILGKLISVLNRRLRTGRIIHSGVIGLYVRSLCRIFLGRNCYTSFPSGKLEAAGEK